MFISRRLLIALIACVSVGLTPTGVLGQGSSEGTITGTVTDPSSSPVSAAQITLRSLQTNSARELKSNSSGEFTIPSLPVGTYELTVSAAGFQSVHIQDIKLDVNSTRRVDVGLTVGQVSESVTVDASRPLLNTEDASTGQVIESKRVTELPLNGRNFQQLQLLTPGSVSTNNFQTSQGLAGGASSLTTNSTMNVANGGRQDRSYF